MGIKQHLTIRSSVLKGHVNKYAILGLIISISSIIVATILVSYQMTGGISLSGLIHAQTSNPAIWALDLTPFMFAYWGQSFCYELASKTELIIEDKTRELVDKRGDLEQKLQYESNHDSLTNLPNIRLLSKRINQGIQQLKKGEMLAVIILNINNFKDVNYTYGNFSANSLLLQFSETLKSLLLEPYMLQSYMGMNMIARLQAAEFAVLIPRLRKDHNLEQIVANIIDGTSKTFMIDGNNINISTTAGVAVYPEHGSNDEELIHHATLCLLHAEKEEQRYAMYKPSMDKGYKTKGIMLKEISSAIDHEEIETLYQPVIQLNNENIVGAEAVIHISSEKYGVFNAEKLIPLVEGTSLVKKLTEFTLRKATEQLVLWHGINQKIFIRVHLFNATDMELPGFIEDLLKRHNMSASYLRVELTEKACLSDQTRSVNFLNKLAEMGIKIAISDFGSGYSSFVYLTNFPIHGLKIDKSFTMNMMKDEKKRKLVHAITRLADAMNLEVFAEGIADKNTLSELKQLGCKYGEGPYFSQPVSAESFTSALRRLNQNTTNIYP